MSIFKPTMLILALGALAACTSAQHIQSQDRLDTGVEVLVAAERAEFEEAKRRGKGGPPTDMAFSASDELEVSAFAARQALAEDALADVEAVSGILANADAADQVAAYYRAAVKAWHAGAAGGDHVASIVSGGRNACKTAEPRPDRDCAMFDLLVALNTAESAADSINAQAVKRIRANRNYVVVAEVKELVKALGVLNRSLNVREAAGSQQNGLARLGTGSDDVMKPFVDRQVLVYWCYAVWANSEVAGSPDRNSGGEDYASAAKSSYEQITTAMEQRNLNLADLNRPTPLTRCQAIASHLAGKPSSAPLSNLFPAGQ